MTKEIIGYGEETKRQKKISPEFLFLIMFCFIFLEDILSGVCVCGGGWMGVGGGGVLPYFSVLLS